MPETLLPDTTNPGPWHYYPASGRLVDQNELPILQFTENAGKQAINIITRTYAMHYRLHKLLAVLEATLFKMNGDGPNHGELKVQAAATRNLLNLIAK